MQPAPHRDAVLVGQHLREHFRRHVRVLERHDTRSVLFRIDFDARDRFQPLDGERREVAHVVCVLRQFGLHVQRSLEQRQYGGIIERARLQSVGVHVGHIEVVTLAARAAELYGLDFQPRRK